MKTVLFDQWGIRTCGVEVGNWYGFSGIPMGTGSASFAELVWMTESLQELTFEARVRMHRLDARVEYAQRIDHDGLTAEMTLKSLSDSVLGDAVLHLTFDPGDSSPRFNGESLDGRCRYHYSFQRRSCLELGPDVRLKITTEMNAPVSDMDLALVPYAARMADGRVRYHTRALCRGGNASSLILRTRGSLSCMSLGKFPVAMGRWLYRIEKRAPRFLRNTQLCAVTAFPRGAEVVLRHRMEGI